MSDNGIPSPSDGPTPPPPAPGLTPPPVLPVAPAQAPNAPANITQAYPGAVPSAAPTAASPYTPQMSPAYGAPGYGASTYSAPTPQQPGYPTYPASAPQAGYAAAAYPVYGAAPAYPAPRPASGLAITSLVCGLAGVLFGTFLFFLVLPFLSSVTAVITGHMALRKTKSDPTVGGRGMAFAGLITGYVMVGISVLLGGVLLISFLIIPAFTLPFVFAV